MPAHFLNFVRKIKEKSESFNKHLEKIRDFID